MTGRSPLDGAFLLRPERSTQARELIDGIAGDQSHSSDHVCNRINAVRIYLRCRRLRERLLPREIFGEPAWDILLDLYAAQLEGKAVSISSACIASAVPTTTALRWLSKLVECGLIERSLDASDARRAHVRITDDGLQAVTRWVDIALLAKPPGYANRP
jgi:DNA-binding MarR family transcriptional regulator